MKDALDSLYGKGHQDAIKAANKARARDCVAGPGQREQTILTPDYILERVIALWGCIALDPCSDPGLSVPAVAHIVHDPDGPGRVVAPQNMLAWLPVADGLAVEWPKYTFVNPPYGTLKDWMIKSAATEAEHIMLVPVRTHRAWFDINKYDAVCFLDPVKFKGYKQAFPAPCALLYKLDAACDYDSDDVSNFYDHFQDLGRITILKEPV